MDLRERCSLRSAPKKQGRAAFLRAARFCQRYPVIFGEYPCCDGDLDLDVPDVTPAFAREECPHCGAVVWHRLSRLDPESWVEADFPYDVNHDTREITPRCPS